MAVQTIPVADHNLLRTNPVTKRRQSIMALLRHAKGGLGGFNEFNSADKAYLKEQAAKLGLSIYIYGTNGMVWDATEVRKISIVPKLISKGGNVGNDEVLHTKDDRKVGPNRYVLMGVFTPVGVLRPFEFDVTHMTHTAFTTRKWKAPLWFKSERRISKFVKLKDGVLTGDFNRNPTMNLPDVADRNVPTPPTMGKQHYDKFVVWGVLKITGTSTFSSPSDHKGIVGTLHIPLSKPPVKVPSKEKYDPKRWRQLGAPVPHPFAKRSAKWKKAHPVMWKRILAFQNKWKRTH